MQTCTHYSSIDLQSGACCGRGVPKPTCSHSNINHTNTRFYLCAVSFDFLQTDFLCVLQLYPNHLEDFCSVLHCQDFKDAVRMATVKEGILINLASFCAFKVVGQTMCDCPPSSFFHLFNELHVQCEEFPECVFLVWYVNV